MTILAALIAHNSQIIVHHSPYTTQFLPLATTILPKIKSRVQSYVYDRFYFHYISGLAERNDSGFVFMCMTGEETTGAVEFLQSLQKDFSDFLDSSKSESSPLLKQSWNTKDLLGLGAEYLPKLQELFKAKAVPTSQVLQNELSSLQSVMSRNVDLVLARGEQLDAIMERTQDLVDSSQAFRRTSRQLGFRMWWQNKRVTIAGVMIVLFVVAITVYALL